MLNRRICLFQFCLIVLFSISEAIAREMSEEPLSLVLGDFTIAVPKNPVKIALSGSNTVIIWESSKGLILDLLDPSQLKNQLQKSPEIPLNKLPERIFSTSNIDPGEPWSDFIVQMRPAYLQGASVVDSLRNGVVEVFYSNSPSRGFTGSAMAIIHRQKNQNYILMIDAKGIPFETFKTLLGTLRPATKR